MPAVPLRICVTNLDPMNRGLKPWKLGQYAEITGVVTNLDPMNRGLKHRSWNIIRALHLVLQT